jgi:alkaline phosphatase
MAPDLGLPALVPGFADIGLLGIAAIALADKIVPILPSYLTFVVVGMLTVSGGSDLVLTIMACTAGSALGSMGWYALGRYLGEARCEAFVQRFGRYAFLTGARYRRIMHAYSRNQFWVSVVSQTIPAVRVYAALPAGVLAFSPRAFLAATCLGALAWNTALLVLGYAARDSGRDLTSAALWTVAGLISAEILVVLIMRQRKLARG